LSNRIVTRQVTGDGQRNQRQPGRERGHEDRRQPLAGAPDNEFAAERLAFLPLEVLEVVDHHDPVPGGDPEHREEADERPERDHPAAEPRREDTPDEGRRQREERQDGEASAAE